VRSVAWQDIFTAFSLMQIAPGERCEVGFWP